MTPDPKEAGEVVGLKTTSFPNIVAFAATLSGYPDHVVAAFATEAATAISTLQRDRDDTRITVLTELRTAPADEEIRKLFSMAQITGGHPKDDDPEGFDAQVGQEFVRLRHKIAAAIFEAGQYAAAHETLDDLARERVASAEADRDRLRVALEEIARGWDPLNRSAQVIARTALSTLGGGGEKASSHLSPTTCEPRETANDLPDHGP